MTNDTDITPALTPREWRNTHPSVGSPEYAHATMAYMNAALPDGDPRKITRDDVRACLDMGQRTWHDPIRGEAPDSLIHLARKLAALLPPE